MGTANSLSSALSRESRFRTLLLFAACFGLVAGLVEGAIFLSFQHFGWLVWDVANLSVAPEILWIAPAFDLALFLVAGLGLVAASAALPRVPILRPAFFLFSSITFYDWIALSGRIRMSGSASLALGLATVATRWFGNHETAGLRAMRRSLPWALAAALLLFAAVESGQRIEEERALSTLPAAAPGAPNILIVVLDAVRADHLAAYGYARATSPTLDGIARQGVQFENAISTSSWTLPAHASLLTGRLPHEHGATNWAYRLHLPNIAEELRGRGFRTGAFSANTLYFTRQKGFGGGFIHFEDVFTSAADMMLRTTYGRFYFWQVLRRTGPGDLPGRKHAEDVNAAFLRWIDRGTKNPFFVVLNYFDAHDPYLPPQPYRSKFSKIPNPGGELNDVVWRLRPRRVELMESEMDAYDGGIAYMDAQIGTLFAALETRGFAQNTLVIILSDHGELFGEHDLYLHRVSLYRPVIHVPMIFYWPGHLHAGTHVKAPVTIASIPATLLDLLGSGAQTDFPGPSLAPLWKEASPPPDFPYPISELGWFPYEKLKKDPSYYGPTVAAVTPRWELIKHEKFGLALFDWTADPNTLNDVVKSPEGERVAAALDRCMKQKRLAMSDAACSPPASSATIGHQ